MAVKSVKPKPAYPTYVSDEEWQFCSPYLELMTQKAPQRQHSLRQMFNAVCYIARAGCPWRMLPRDLPPWASVYQQWQRWNKAGCMETMAHDLRMMLRLLAQKNAQTSAVILDGRTMQSTPESGARADYDGYKRKKGSKAHIAVDTLGHLLALKITAANEQERAQVGELAQKIQEVTKENVELAYADQGYTGETPAEAAQAEGIDLEVVKLQEAKKGFVLLPRRWVVERSFAWSARFRRLSRDYERLAASLESIHWLPFSTSMLNSLIKS